MIATQASIQSVNTVSVASRDNAKALLKEHIANAAKIKKMQEELARLSNRQDRICDMFGRFIREPQVVRIGRKNFLIEPARIGSAPVTVREVTIF